ncbi:MAG: sulfurtransferase TusC, partial [Deltaproteobacteria bacterium]|nr:sulfurtransferase TusC [Deltaproteobacteria bacterium]
MEERDYDDEVVKKIMHIMRRAPHGSIYSYEGLEMI